MNISRRGFLKAGALTAAGLAGGLPAQASQAENPSAPLQGALRPTSFGPVQGRETEAGGGLAWYGVPYGAAPSGSLRWQPPQDPAPWSDPLDCTAPAPMALQCCNGMAVGTEDCLKLDVYAPDGAAGLPVVVYFHGGGNRTGSPEELPGGSLSARAECVLVSVGYRLGLLGFNSLPALQNGPDSTGNYALLDAAKAFDWVQENIASFGGDPANVTAMGFSAGGRDVLAMLASPYFAGRFQRAVSLSGGLTMADPDASARQTAAAFAPLAVEDGLFSDPTAAADWLLTNGEDVTRWLYDLDPARVCLLMADGGGIRMSSFPHLFADGVLLPENGLDAPLSCPVPLLLVTGTTEFSLFNPLTTTVQTNGLSAADTAAARDFATAYGSKLYRIFNGGAAAASLSSRSTAPVWVCEIAYGGADSASPIRAMGLGSYHGISLPLLSGENNLSGFVSLSSPGFAALSDRFTAAFRFFIRTGTPDGAGVDWQPWTAASPRALVLDAGNSADSAVFTLQNTPSDCGAVLDRLDADNSVPDSTKELVIRQILNGRIFSAELDARYQNPSLWV